MPCLTAFEAHDFLRMCVIVGMLRVWAVTSGGAWRLHPWPICRVGLEAGLDRVHGCLFKAHPAGSLPSVALHALRKLLECAPDVLLCHPHLHVKVHAADVAKVRETLGHPRQDVCFDFRARGENWDARRTHDGIRSDIHVSANFANAPTCPDVLIRRSSNLRRYASSGGTGDMFDSFKIWRTAPNLVMPEVGVHRLIRLLILVLRDKEVDRRM